MSLILNKIKKEVLVHCPLCQSDYKSSSLRTVEDAGAAVLLHSQCPKCQGAVLSLLQSDLFGVTMIGLATDLDYNDSVKFKDAELVDDDQVLAMYRLVN